LNEKPSPSFVAVEENGFTIGPPVRQDQARYSTSGTQIHPTAGADLSTGRRIRHSTAHCVSRIGEALGMGDVNVEGSVS
jgi:hypothetical protein